MTSLTFLLWRQGAARDDKTTLLDVSRNSPGLGNGTSMRGAMVVGSSIRGSTESSKPIVEPSKPIVEPSKPIVEPSKPIVEPSKPIVEPSKLIVAPSKPIVEPSKPIVEPTKPIVEPSKPIVEPSKPIVEPSKPIVAPSKPIVEPSKPIVEPSKPIVEQHEVLYSSEDAIEVPVSHFSSHASSREFSGVAEPEPDFYALSRSAVTLHGGLDGGLHDGGLHDKGLGLASKSLRGIMTALDADALATLLRLRGLGTRV